MKIRQDFVTNSSSSSFIVCFKKGEDIRETIEKEYRGEWVDMLVNDLKRGVKPLKRLSSKEKQEIFDMLRDDAWWKHYNELQRRFGRYSDVWEYENQHKADCEAEIEKIQRDMYNKILEHLAECDRMAIVEYEDHTNFGSELEHEIMPNLSCTLYRISHH